MASIHGIGRLGRDPRMQYLPKGTAMTHITVATDSGFGSNKKTTWVNLVSFGQQAETLNKWLKKGSRILFEAELTEVKSFEKKDGSTGFSVEGKIFNVSFIDGLAEQDEAREDGNEFEPEEF